MSSIAQVIEWLIRMAEILETHGAGTSNNRFVTDYITLIAEPLVGACLVIVSFVTIITSLVDIVYICIPIARIGINKLGEHSVKIFGKHNAGIGSTILAVSTRREAARRGEIDGVAAGLIYYLKKKVAFLIIVGVLLGLFNRGEGLTKITNDAGNMMVEMYSFWDEHTGPTDITSSRYEGDMQ